MSKAVDMKLTTMPRRALASMQRPDDTPDIQWYRRFLLHLKLGDLSSAELIINQTSEDTELQPLLLIGQGGYTEACQLWEGQIKGDNVRDTIDASSESGRDIHVLWSDRQKSRDDAAESGKGGLDKSDAVAQFMHCLRAVFRAVCRAETNTCQHAGCPRDAERLGLTIEFGLQTLRPCRIAKQV